MLIDEMKIAAHRAILFSAALLVCAAPCHARGYSPLGYPGSAWVNGSHNFDGLEGSGTQGWVRQGVKWFRSSALDFSTYASYFWRIRSKNNTYYDANGPGLSAAVESGPFSLGLESAEASYPGLRDTSRNTSLSGNWYYGVDVFKCRFQRARIEDVAANEAHVFAR